MSTNYMLRDVPLPAWNDDIVNPKIPLQPHNLSPNEIVPQEDQHRLMAIDDAMTQGFFEIGDIACRLISFAPQFSRDGQTVVTHDDVYQAVSVFCRREPRTVRYYAETAAFFSPEVRYEFDALPFSVFVLARSFGARWREVLEFADANPMMSASSMRMHFTAIEAETALDDARDDEEKRELKEANPLSERAGATILAALSKTIDALRKLINRANLSEDVRERLGTILADIANVLPELRRDIESMTEEE